MRVEQDDFFHVNSRMAPRATAAVPSASDLRFSGGVSYRSSWNLNRMARFGASAAGHSSDVGLEFEMQWGFKLVAD